MLAFMISLAHADDLSLTHVDPDPIINGVNATADDYPMAGGLLMDGLISFSGFGDQPLHSFICSSTLIAPDVVLTAAHCIDESALTFGFGTVENLEVRWSRQSDLTSWDGSNPSSPWPEDAVAAWDWVAHPDFDMQDFDIGIAENNDIALVFLDRPITDIPHAYLPTDNLGELLNVGDEVNVVGWGQQTATSQFDAPPQGTFAIKQQGASTISELGRYEFQVGALTEEVRKCHGDSGGPSFLEMNGALRVVGVTSHAYDDSDCFETGGVDTRVDAFLDWIDDEMRLRCDDGTRAWCEVPGIVNPDSMGNNAGNSDEEDSEKRSGCSSTAHPAQWLLVLLSMVAFGYRRRQSSTAIG
ncbi:MAG: trypsin-like serine protease [Myxococcota bacterium]|nr:trypsin-like serine protease [Myxococcota bacterium]